MKCHLLYPIFGQSRFGQANVEQAEKSEKKAFKPSWIITVCMTNSQPKSMKACL